MVTPLHAEPAWRQDHDACAKWLEDSVLPRARRRRTSTATRSTRISAACRSAGCLPARCSCASRGSFGSSRWRADRDRRVGGGGLRGEDPEDGGEVPSSPAQDTEEVERGASAAALRAGTGRETRSIPGPHDQPWLVGGAPSRPCTGSTASTALRRRKDPSRPSRKFLGTSGRRRGQPGMAGDVGGGGGGRRKLDSEEHDPVRRPSMVTVSFLLITAAWVHHGMDADAQVPVRRSRPRRARAPSVKPEWRASTSTHEGSHEVRPHLEAGRHGREVDDPAARRGRRARWLPATRVEDQRGVRRRRPSGPDRPQSSTTRSCTPLNDMPYLSSSR